MPPRTRNIALAVMILFLAFSAMGSTPDDVTRARHLLEKGDQAWARRGNPAHLHQAIEFYGQAARLDPSAGAWVKLAEADYWLGETLPPENKKERIAAYEACHSAAMEAIEISQNDPGANLWATVCNGRRTEVVGLLSGTYDLGLAIICLGRVARYDNDYYHGAIYRYWGRFVFEIPELGRRLIHFDLEDSVTLLQEGLEIEPNFFLTRLYLAETYLAAERREEAKRELLYIVNTSPDVLACAEPENRFYQAQARALLQREFPDVKPPDE